MTKWEERKRLFLDTLNERGKMSVAEISELLEVSDSTARRLITDMEKDQLLLKKFGGVQKLEFSEKRYSYLDTFEKNAKKKAAIGKAAASIVQDGDVIYLSGGSTVCQMAISLSDRIKRRELNNVSIVTNSIVAMQALGNVNEVIVPGGIYRPSLQVVDGSVTEKELRGMYFTKAFLGVVALRRESGFMVSDISTNMINEIVCDRSDRFYVLADSEKIGKQSFKSYSGIAAAEGIIIDNGITHSEIKSFEKAGAHLKIVSVQE